MLESTEYLRTVIETMDAGLMVVDTHGEIVSANQALIEMTGFTRNELIGSLCSILSCDVCFRARETGAGKHCELFTRGGVRRRRCELKRKDGAPVYVLKNAAVLRDDRGEIVGGVETVTDIGEIVARDRELADLRRTIGVESGYQGLLGKSAPMRRLFRTDRKRGGVRGSGPDPGGERHGQGTGRCGHPPVGRPLLGPVHQGQLRGPERRPAGKRAVRPRQGRLHRSGPQPDGPFRGGQRRGLLPGRSRGPAAGHPGQAVAGAPGKGSGAGGRTDPAFGGREGDQRHQQGSQGPDAPGRLSGGFVLPHRRDTHPGPPLAGASGGHPPAGGRLSRPRGRRGDRPVLGFSREAMDHLMAYQWPGNVRELINAVEYAFVICRENEIRPEHLPAEIGAGDEALICRDPMPSTGRDRIMEALRHTGGRKIEAAKLLGISRVTLWKRMKEYGITSLD